MIVFLKLGTAIIQEFCQFTDVKVKIDVKIMLVSICTQGTNIILTMKWIKIIL